MKNVFVVILIVLLSTFYWLMPAAVSGQARRGQTQIGYVSGQRILTETSQGKAEVARLQTLQQQKTTELRAKQQTLEATRQQLVQASENPTRTQLQQQEQQQRIELERATTQAQIDLQALQRQLQSDFQTRLKPVVEEVAKTEDVQIVINGDNAVVWAAPSLDLTSLVIDRLNGKPKL
jgi:Skp family chaperone for outer membrane proteins